MSAQPEFYFMQCLDIFKLETPNGISESRERAKVRVSVFFRNPIECKCKPSCHKSSSLFGEKRQNGEFQTGAGQEIIETDQKLTLFYFTISSYNSKVFTELQSWV